MKYNLHLYWQNSSGETEIWQVRENMQLLIIGIWVGSRIPLSLQIVLGTPMDTEPYSSRLSLSDSSVSSKDWDCCTAHSTSSVGGCISLWSWVWEHSHSEVGERDDNEGPHRHPLLITALLKWASISMCGCQEGLTQLTTSMYQEGPENQDFSAQILF